MAPEMPPFGNYPDPDAERALAWFIGFLPPKDWRERVERIEERLQIYNQPGRVHEDDSREGAPRIAEDRIGWYLYLVDKALHDCINYEPLKGSRVLCFRAPTAAAIFLTAARCENASTNAVRSLPRQSTGLTNAR